MSYLYDRLKDALGGNRLTESKSSVISDWSPNSIRAIFLCKDSIIIVNHLGVFGGCTRKIDMDINLVLKDVEEINRTNYGKPKLNTLLTKRSFSCLEEIYVDVCYASMPRVINLVDYVGDLVKTNNFRLRYYGYGDFSNFVLRDYLNKAYKEAYSRKDYGYSFAMDSDKPVSLKFQDLENNDWYRRYYLRPQFYKKDSQGGDLDIHFKKIEKGYPEYIKRLNQRYNEEELKNNIREVISRDMSNLDYLKKIDRLFAYVSRSQDKICKLVATAIKKTVFMDRRVVGFTEDMLWAVFGKNSLAIKNLLQYYKLYMVLSKSSNGSLDVASFKGKVDGFIPLGDILDEMCVAVTEAVVKEGYKDLVAVALVCNLNIPNGKFSAKYLNKMERSKGETSYIGYIDYIEEIIGAEV